MTNSKSTKRALVSSALAVFLCVAMLIGTTFAWFTDTATTGVNKIQAGTLDVGLEMYENGEWVNAEGKTLNFKAADGNTNILWEPGCTYELPTLRIVNNGNLALKYEVVITGINGNEKLNEVIEWKYSAMFANGTYTYPADMEGNILMTGVMYPGDESSLPDYMPASGTFKIIGHMKESAGNEYQGLSINGISITVVATQAQYEYDSTGKTYDKDATLPSFWDGRTETAPTMTEGVYHITNAAEFAQYINELNNDPSHGAHRYDSAKVVLDCDIDLGGAVLTASDEGWAFDGQFDGNGHTVRNFTVKRTDGEYYTALFSVYMSALDTGREVFIKNLTVENGTVISNGKQVAAIVPSVYDNATVENCHTVNCIVSGVKKVGAVAGYVEEGTVKNCSAKDCSVYASENNATEATIFGYNNGGTFTDNTDKGGNTLSYGITPAFVSTAADLSSAMHKGGNIVLLNDITVESWTSVRVDTANPYQPIANSISIDGNGHSISGLTSSLLGYNPAQYVEIKNLTIKNSNIVSNEAGNNANCGAFAAMLDNFVLSFKMSNCHAVNVNVTANNSGAYGAGVLVGYQGMTTGNKVFSIVDCTVTGGSVTNTNGNAAGIVGMCYTNANCAIISGCSVSGVTVRGEAANKQGPIAGTICNGGGSLEIANCTYTGNAYGRLGDPTVNVNVH